VLEHAAENNGGTNGSEYSRGLKKSFNEEPVVYVAFSLRYE
jgi:hypothetical protein